MGIVLHKIFLFVVCLSDSVRAMEGCSPCGFIFSGRRIVGQDLLSFVPSGDEVKPVLFCEERGEERLVLTTSAAVGDTRNPRGWGAKHKRYTPYQPSRWDLAYSAPTKARRDFRAKLGKLAFQITKQKNASWANRRPLHYGCCMYIDRGTQRAARGGPTNNSSRRRRSQRRSPTQTVDGGKASNGCSVRCCR